MYSKEKLLQMLASSKPSERYEACEWIRVSQESSPEIVNALEKASHDLDKEVAERANLALRKALPLIKLNKALGLKNIKLKIFPVFR